jgi:translation elongation factor EF-1alpha
LKRRPVAAERTNTLRDYTERLEGRDLLNLVVVGHVDAGKSTLMGHVLVKLKVVDDRTMHKNRTEATRLGKDSFSFAFVLDESEEERQRGVTMDIAQAQFKTKTKIVNLVDAPGHKGLNTKTKRMSKTFCKTFICCSSSRFYSKYDQWRSTSRCSYSCC